VEQERWARPEAVSAPEPPPYQYDALVSRLKQARREGRAPAIAIVSATPGAGVSTVTRALTGRMNAGLRARRTEDVTVSLPAGEVMGSGDSVAKCMARICKQHRHALESVFDPGLAEQGHAHEPAAGFEDCLLTARSLFRMVLVECRPLKRSADIASVALLVDAVLIVVEANKTTRAQTERLVHTIHTAGGSVLGYVLNKRTFPVPSSVYQIFEKAGLI
jgi:hypothetical protein